MVPGQPHTEHASSDQELTQENNAASSGGSDSSPAETSTQEATPGSPEWLPAGADGQYLLVVNYDDEAERVRMNDALQPYNDEQVVQPRRAVRVLTDNVDLEGLVSSLLSKVPQEHIYLAEITEEPDLESHLDGEAELRYTFDEKPENINNVLNFIMTNRSGRMKSPTERRYEFTRSGYVEVTFSTYETDDELAEGEVCIELEGQAEPVATLKSKFLADLRDLDEQDT